MCGICNMFALVQMRSRCGRGNHEAFDLSGNNIRPSYPYISMVVCLFFHLFRCGRVLRTLSLPFGAKHSPIFLI